MYTSFPAGPIPTVKIPFAVVNYDFQSLAAGDGDSIPNLLSNIDVLLAEFAAAIDAQIIFGSVLDSGIADMVTSAFGIDNSADLPQLDQFAGAASSIDVAAGSVTSALTAESTTALPPTPGSVQSLRPNWVPDPNRPGCYIVPGGGEACL